jgi:SHS2 domain-containing protein
MSYEILDGISRADIAYRVRGKNPPDLFQNGALALMAIMLENPESVLPAKSVQFDMKSSDLDLLYFDFLSEFIYYKDSQKMILIPASVDIRRSGDGYSLSCLARGENIDRTRHNFRADIKAVTLHNLSVMEENNEWTASVVVDV